MLCKHTINNVAQSTIFIQQYTHPTTNFPHPRPCFLAFSFTFTWFHECICNTMAVQGDTEYLVLETTQSEQPLQPFRIPPRRDWLLPTPWISSLEDVLKDKGDYVAHQFFLLNPNLPPTEFTIGNVIEYVMKTLFARNPDWKQFPRKVGSTPICLRLVNTRYLHWETLPVRRIASECVLTSTSGQLPSNSMKFRKSCRIRRGHPIPNHCFPHHCSNVNF